MTPLADLEQHKENQESDPLAQLRYRPIQWTEEERRRYTPDAIRAAEVVDEECWYGLDCC
jgi:hypothetical protein